MASERLQNFISQPKLVSITRQGGPAVGTITQRDANGFVVGIRQPKVTGSAAQAPDGSLAAALTNQATQATSNDARY
ncbi:hypothetical protein, partial [Acidovorax sp. PRC11]|uniref:hypothetical protein n=1 Tax=Acidovorax sp. PRC11 TaxID=2962592 RepID=UPI0028813392